MSTVVIAIGGNAIIQNGQKGTVEEQFENVKKSCEPIIDLIEKGYNVVLTHGNGPHVGNELLKNEAGKAIVPQYTIDVCGAETEGSIGYIISQVMVNELKERGINKKVASLVTQTLVDRNDPAFKNPTKPIGPFYSEEESKELMETKGYVMVEDAGRGYRRVVPSPKPIEIVDSEVIKTLCDNNYLVITAGGGGIPVVYGKDAYLEGVEAVIDKDRAAALLAKEIEADYLMILTGVEQVAINYGKPDMKNLEVMTLLEAKEYMIEGQFPAGSMGPKIESVCDFVENSTKEVTAIITAIDKMAEAMDKKTGTRVVK